MFPGRSEHLNVWLHTCRYLCRASPVPARRHPGTNSDRQYAHVPLNSKGKRMCISFSKTALSASPLTFQKSNSCNSPAGKFTCPSTAEYLIRHTEPFA